MLIVSPKVVAVNPPLGSPLNTKYQVNAHRRYDRAHQVRMLRDHRTHEETAIASTQKRQLCWARPLLPDQIFGSRCKIIEDVLLFCEIASLVPFLPEFASAANVRDHVNTAAVEPEPAREFKIRRHAEAITTVTVKQRRIVAVQVCAFAANNVKRNFCAVLR